MKAFTISASIKLPLNCSSLFNQNCQPEKSESGGAASQVTKVLHQDERPIELAARELRIHGHSPQHPISRCRPCRECGDECVALRLRKRTACVDVEDVNELRRWKSHRVNERKLGAQYEVI